MNVSNFFPVNIFSSRLKQLPKKLSENDIFQFLRIFFFYNEALRRMIITECIISLKINTPITIIMSVDRRIPMLRSMSGFLKTCSPRENWVLWRHFYSWYTFKVCQNCCLKTLRTKTIRNSRHQIPIF